MDAQTMRKRGWSIHSETSNADQSVEMGSAEKQSLLDNFPSFKDHEADERNGDGGEPPRKRAKSSGDDNNGETSTTPADDAVPKTDSPPNELLEVAKGRLSKWAARLFDPDRPRGLVQAPAVIPLNDEFLQAFGKREREFDAQAGRIVDIDRATLDEDEDEEDDTGPVVAKAIEEKIPVEGRKVKVGNIAFRTTAESLRKACERFGQIETVNLLMDETTLDRLHPQNKGIAYVTFDSAEAAKNCVVQLKNLDGRQLRVNLAASLPSRSTSSGAPNLSSRYWDKDISTKCFRCGMIGHMERRCTNPASRKPCHLCGLMDHDWRGCPKSRICFKCGVPGHINRDCPYERALPKRMVCGICLESGHHRLSCGRRPGGTPIEEAICMVCGERGHFMCQEMKFFFGLDGVTCFNCGRGDHQGYDCHRPTLDQCARDEETTKREIERAEAFSLTDELEKQRRKRRERERRQQMDRPPHQSQPPPSRAFGRYDSGASRSYSEGGAQGYMHGGGYRQPQQQLRRGYSDGGRGYGHGSSNRGYGGGSRGYGGNRR